MQQTFDLIVVGAGPGGYVSAIRAAQSGMQVAIVEQAELGGTCLNRGCIPTKTLLHVAELYHEMQRCETLGLSVKEVSFDTEKIDERKKQVVQGLREGVSHLLQANKVKVFTGKAVIKSADSVVVTREGQALTLQTKRILIATGATPTRPPIEGLSLQGVLTSDEILGEAMQAYRNLLIIGGGVIGMEFATIYRALACEVTVLEAADRILPTMDREISQNLNLVLKKRGVSTLTAATVTKIEQSQSGLLCHYTQKGTEHSIQTDAILVAVGRTPNLQGLFGPDVEVACQRGIVVNEFFQTNVPTIYAIGDVVAGGIQLAHMASAQGCNAVAHMVGEPAPMNLAVIPSCLYTDPEIASVGMTPDQAKQEGIAVETAKFLSAGLGKSLITQQERGFIKLVFDKQSRVLLGAQLICARATDLVSELASAIVGRLTIEQLGSVVRPHPTFSEGISEAVESVEGRAIHIAPKSR